MVLICFSNSPSYSWEISMEYELTIFVSVLVMDLEMKMEDLFDSLFFWKTTWIFSNASSSILFKFTKLLLRNLYGIWAYHIFLSLGDGFGNGNGRWICFSVILENYLEFFQCLLLVFQLLLQLVHKLSEHVLLPIVQLYALIPQVYKVKYSLVTI